MTGNNGPRQVGPILLGTFLFLALLPFSPVFISNDTYGQTRPEPGAAERATPSRSHPLSNHGLLRHNDAVTIAIPDIEFTDQDNQTHNLYKDLMKDKLVVLNLFYTTCAGVCPTAGLWFSRLQDKLGERLGRDVVLISISIDPDVDTPQKINQWASRWHRKPGWTLLTSKEKAARDLVKRFLAYDSNGTHSPVLFVGNGGQATIDWVRVDVLNEGVALLDFLEKGKDK